MLSRPPPIRTCFALLLAVPLLATPLHAGFLSQAQATGSAPDPLALRWERYELPNGLEVVLLPDSTRDEVAVELWTHAGTRHEPVGKYGMAHFFEHALPHGALLRTGAVVALADSLRTGSNARTRPDYTRYYQRTTPEGTGLFLLMAAARLSSDPAVDLTEGRVESERGRVLAEMARWTDHRWGEPIGATLRRGTFGADHPYGHDGYGTPEETLATTRDDLVRWHRAHVRPEYTTLFVAGGFDPEPVRAYVDLVFGRIPGGPRPPREASRVPEAGGGADTMTVAADDSYLFLAWPTPEWAHADAPLLELFGRILSGRLAPGATGAPPGLREMSVEADGRELAGAFTIVATHDPAADRDALERWVRRALRSALEGMAAAELDAARAAERKRIAGFHEQLGWIGGRIELVGESLVFANDPDRWRSRREAQESAGIAAVRAAARKWLERPAYVLAVHGAGAAAEMD